ncbi:MAG: hypothetical protein JW774_13165 [Candidatus Aureabacteria bacterium]|nr:hypothetical protein [Candidatus Auribacterota bacterium]
MKIRLLYMGMLSFLIGFTGCRSNPIERIKLAALKGKKEINYSINREGCATIQRVLIMPVKNDTDIQSAAEETYHLLLLQLSKCNYFESVSWRDMQEDALNRFQLLGNTPLPAGDDLESIKKLGKDYQIDAVLFPEVKQYRAYRPLFFGYKHKMIQTSDSAILWMVDEAFDMAEPNVNRCAKNWYYRTHGEENNPGLKSELMDISMNSLIQFALFSILETWLK